MYIVIKKSTNIYTTTNLLGPAHEVITFERINKLISKNSIILLHSIKHKLDF